MTQERHSNKLFLISILLSIISIIGTIAINIKIANNYLDSDAKTRALFGIKEILLFGYKYYLLIPGFIALVLAIVDFSKSMNRVRIITSGLLSLLAIAMVFLRIWRLFI